MRTVIDSKFERQADGKWFKVETIEQSVPTRVRERTEVICPKNLEPAWQDGYAARKAEISGHGSLEIGGGVYERGENGVWHITMPSGKDISAAMDRHLEGAYQAGKRANADPCFKCETDTGCPCGCGR